MKKPNTLGKAENARLYVDFYSKLFGDLIKNKAKCDYEFTGLTQARIVTSGLISAANNDLCIGCNSFSPELWMDPKVFASISRAIDRKVSFNIWSGDSVPSYLEAYLLSHGVGVHYADLDCSTVGNILVCDSRAYSIMDPLVFRGIAVFNDPISAVNLKTPLE